MLDLADRLKAFVQLGEMISAYINRIGEQDSLQLFDNVISESFQQNPWFTEHNIFSALKGVSSMLHADALDHWVSNYPIIEHEHGATVAVIMAGNIPLVGFHDFLTVLVSGHIFLGKPSAADSVLLKALASLLCEIEPRFEQRIRFEMNQLRNFDAVIATGSNNSARYFDYYFGKYPHIIRANRSSVAVLTGDENEDDFKGLYDDITMFYGLGCRNVSKIFIPQTFAHEKLMAGLQDFRNITAHPKYFNNYEYNKALYLINQTPHFDNGFLLLKEDTTLSSPVSVLHFETYHDLSEVKLSLKINAGQLQCIVSKNAFLDGSVPFGQAQFPQLGDYADGIDTMDFLLKLA